MCVFARIVELGGFTRAESLGITKSTVSRGMQVLEDRLGVKLVHRTTRNTSVTREGAMYYERCSRIFASIEEAERHIGVRRLQGGNGGSASEVE
nr:LysR family transcriptional regulator [Cupriavidus sp. IDO]